MMSRLITDAQIDAFRSDGFLVLRRFLSPGAVEQIQSVAIRDLRQSVEPLELEASVGYPGAPASVDVEGGRTVRRLLQAVDRDPAIREFATGTDIATALHPFLGPKPVLVRAHHNCIMTKHPNFGSETGWHRDVRYWSFTRPDLVSAWLALGPETLANGGLLLIPGSHRIELPPAALDAAEFLRPDHAEGAALISHRTAIELEAGDLLLFHCRTLHAAGRNQTVAVKMSAVFTYRDAENQPIPGTRSAGLQDVPVQSPAGVR